MVEAVAWVVAAIVVAWGLVRACPEIIRGVVGEREGDPMCVDRRRENQTDAADDSGSMPLHAFDGCPLCVAERQGWDHPVVKAGDIVGGGKAVAAQHEGEVQVTHFTPSPQTVLEIRTLFDPTGPDLAEALRRQNLDATGATKDMEQEYGQDHPWPQFDRWHTEHHRGAGYAESCHYAMRCFWRWMRKTGVTVDQSGIVSRGESADAPV